MQDIGEGLTFSCLIQLTGGLTLTRSRKLHFRLLLLTFVSINDFPVCVYSCDEETEDRRERFELFLANLSCISNKFDLYHQYGEHVVISIALLKGVTCDGN